MKFGVVAVLTTAAAAVWVFAAIGVITVARAVGDQGSPAPVSLLEQTDDADAADIAGLPRYPGSSRTEYRQATWGDVSVSEAEYRTSEDVAAVRRFYRDVFREGAWELLRSEVLHGEWIYEVARGDRDAEIEIERVDGVTEIEIEVVEPVPNRGSPTGR